MSFIEDILCFVFPKRCVCCGKIIRKFEDLCIDCAKLMKTISAPCLSCGADKKHCMCKYNVYRFNGCIAPFIKDDFSIRVLYSFKIGDNYPSGKFLADKMYDKIIEFYGDIKFDAVTAVPMRPSKKLSKGYNQSEWLAKHIANRLDLPYKNLLKYIGKGKPQHNLKRHERFENTKTLYKGVSVNNIKTVLLIDDIKSTGATLDACTRELMFAGIEEVWCATGLVNCK